MTQNTAENTYETRHFPPERVKPPQSWRIGRDHLEQLLTNPWYRMLAELASATYSATVTFFEAEGCSNLPVPVTTMSVSSPMGLGSDSLPVRTEIAGNKVYLADSLQFLLELGLRMSDRPPFYVSNSFRGEEVDKTHLSEFSHAEVEIEGDLEAIMGMGERYVTHLARHLLSTQAETIKAAAGGIEHLEAVAARDRPFAQIRFADAERRLASLPGAFEEVAPGVRAITRLGEQELMRRLGAPLWLTQMPALACPFYQRPIGDGEYCASADLLLGPGEILGCGARCVDGDEVKRSLERHQVSGDDYEWYVTMKARNPMETAGFGLGLERFYMWALQADDIRDCTFWIRRNGEVIGP